MSRNTRYGLIFGAIGRARLTALLLAAGATTCFTGDDLVDQPCRSDDDCNPRVDVLGQTLRCVHNVCGYTARCGDGIVISEECDDANSDNTDACLNDCHAARCGDDLVQKGVEECDDGNSADGDGCSTACTFEGCGDGIKQGDESCDDGNSADGDGCSARCGFETCGDGIVQGQEECDDANQTNTDKCVSCLEAYCGDGVTRQGQEECDDGNLTQTDACLNTCKLADCADGFLRAGVEDCDDGNSADNDACVDSCRTATCGDGFLWAGQEDCDDGNPDNSDDCLNSCALNVCGDGFVHLQKEGCDDANADNNDGCAKTCTMGAVAIGSGPASDHICAVRDGGVRCWGYNLHGQLGYGNTASLGDEPGELPRLDIDAGGIVTRVVTAERFTCVLLDTKAVRCWGYDSFANLGTGGQNDPLGDNLNELPAPAAIIGGDVMDLDAGYDHACALLVGGAVRCWGGGGDLSKLGHLGQGFLDTPDKLGDVEVGGVVTQIATGEKHTCALLVGGQIRCWGVNDEGQLGYPDVDEVGDDETPASMLPVEIGGLAVQIDAGKNHTCALLDAGGLRCWGANDGGELGIAKFGEVGDDETPAAAGTVKMLQPGDKVVKIALGGDHTCALLEGGALRCWGVGHKGQLGYEEMTSLGYSDDPENLPPLVNVGGEVRDIVLGSETSCALLDGGAVRCWGANLEGQNGVNQDANIGDHPGEMPPKDALLYPNP